MSHKITSAHLQRIAGVYIRQSSLGQVKNNRESYRVQKGLELRASALGWSIDRVKTFEADQGQSASKPMARDGFDELLRMIQQQQVGIVFSVDVARLARNAIDIGMLIHWCAVHGTLIADEHQVYDPSAPEDSLVLGIQGVLAVSELHAIRKRLQAGLDQKAARGELYHGVGRGYVVVNGIHLRKHPNARVQQVVLRVLNQFATCTSVSALLRWAWDERLQLPRATSSDGMQIEWVQPSYRGLMDMLRNPTYAGVYVRPRYQRQTGTTDSGKVQPQCRLSRPDEWTTELHDHHPAYISFAQYQANQEKIEMNAQRYTSSRGSVNRGASLLAGLVTCRNCGHKMQVRYGSRGNVSYDCTNGRRQRNKAGAGCFRFAADELEQQLSEQVLYAVSPAGVAAAEQAAERLASDRSDRRSTLTNQLEQLRYDADLTRRRIDAVDPANRLVYSTLCDEWEANLQAVSRQEFLLSQFDTDDPPRPTDEERMLLNQLGARLDRLWYDEDTIDGSFKQQVVRLLIDHVYAELSDDEDDVVLWLKWTTGHHTQLCASRRRKRKRESQVDLAALLQSLRKIADDHSISRTLNRHQIKTDTGQTWTARRVASARRRHGVPCFDATLKQTSGWLTQAEAATKLQISPMSLNRLIQAGLVECEGEQGLPRVISLSALSNKAIQAAVNHIRNHKNAPLPTNPKQKTLSF